MPLAFLGGLHGAGKSTLASALCSELPLEHHSASDLIRHYRPLGPTKSVKDVRGNQDALILALEDFRARGAGILLDGHFALLHESGRAVPVPIDTFARIAPVALITLAIEPEEARTRLLARDTSAPSLQQLSELQDLELNHAEAVSEALALPLLLLDTPDLRAAAAFLRPLVGSR